MATLGYEKPEVDYSTISHIDTTNLSSIGALILVSVFFSQEKWFFTVEMQYFSNVWECQCVCVCLCVCVYWVIWDLYSRLVKYVIIVCCSKAAVILVPGCPASSVPFYVLWKWSVCVCVVLMRPKRIQLNPEQKSSFFFLSHSSSTHTLANQHPRSLCY